ncbi:MAG: hypothetical protein U0Q18_02380 [Bryobacteraceae bacterium]
MPNSHRSIEEELCQRAGLRHSIANWLLLILAFGIEAGIARADFTKTITVVPGSQVNAVTTWYYSNCSTSLGVGTYVVNVAPKYGELAFGTLSGPVPGCPPGSPSLPAAAAYYTWTDTTGASADYFQLYFELNGSVAEIIDVTVELAAPECTITSQTVATVPGIDNSRTTIGIGEVVSLSAAVPVSWGISGGGSFSDDCSGSSQTCTFTAPAANSTTSITATVAGSSCSTTFTTLQPTGLIFQRMQSPPLANPGYKFADVPPLFYDIGMVSVVFMTPGNVSFANIKTSEHDTPNPKLIPPTNLLFSVGGTNAWLIGCDIDIDPNVLTDVLTKKSYWVYDAAGQETQFSLVETQTSHVSLLGGFYYYKGQIAALGPNGMFAPTPGAPAATLRVPRTAVFENIPFPTAAQCPGYVEQQFSLVPGATPGIIAR